MLSYHNKPTIFLQSPNPTTDLKLKFSACCIPVFGQQEMCTEYTFVHLHMCFTVIFIFQNVSFYCVTLIHTFCTPHRFWNMSEITCAQSVVMFSRYRRILISSIPLPNWWPVLILMAVTHTNSAVCLKDLSLLPARTTRKSRYKSRWGFFLLLNKWISLMVLFISTYKQHKLQVV